MNKLMTHRGLKIDAPEAGDIVTITLDRDRSFSQVIFEVMVVSASACVCRAIWSGSVAVKVGEKLIFRHNGTTYHEARDLLDALEEG